MTHPDTSPETKGAGGNAGPLHHDRTYPSGGRRIHSDLYVAAAIMAFCAVVYGITFTFPSVPVAFQAGMEAKGFPRIVIGTMVVLTLVMAWLSRSHEDEEREPVRLIVYTTSVGIFLVALTVEWIGLYPAIFLSTIGIGRLWGERRWHYLVLSAIGVSIGVYIIFTLGFKMPLPTGTLTRDLF